MDNQKNIRNSSLELLRIFCMFLIIFSHYYTHGNISFVDKNISFNEIFLNVISMGGNFACAIFILISGYFMVESKFKLNKIIKLVIKVFLYGLLITIFFVIFKPFKIGIIELINSILYPFYGAWYVRSYIIIYLISPYLNKMLKALSKEEYKKFIVIMVGIWSVISTIFVKSGKLFSGFDGLLILYIIGAYIKLYDVKLSSKASLVLFAVTTIFEIAIIISFIIAGHYLNINAILTNARYITTLYSTLNVISALSLFNYARKYKIKSKTINWLASGTLGIYLIHDHSFVRNYIWNVLYPNTNFSYSNNLIIHFFTKCILVFIICLAIDKILDKIQKITIDKIIDKYM